MKKVLQKPSVDYVKLSGHINDLNAEELQQDLMQRLVNSRCSVVVADMSGVESLDSGGLMALVSVLHSAHESGKSFALANVPQSIQIILELSQLDQAFDFVDDVLLSQQTEFAPVAA
ncbi:MAG: STAS domain-containing protein [Cyanobacteria bacterium P01_E01_bin.6]